jgi:NADPH:quinone reductase-like Zn-dependent oxidoreductase
MKAIQVNEYGGAEQLKEVEIPRPVAGRGQVVVRVYATSFNPVDSKRVSGKMRQAMPIAFPYIPGGDFSGVIDSVAENISGYQPGDEVYGDTETAGAYAEFLAVDVTKLAPKPRNLSHIEAASLALVAQTALQALDHAKLQSGQIILIHGASGAVGSAAVQLAHLRGAYVIASGSADSLDRLRSYGADKVFDYKTTRFETVAGNADAVLDGVGGDVQQRSYAVLKPGGILVAISQPPSQIEAQKHGVSAMMFSTDSSIDTLRQVTAAVEAGELKPFVAKTYPLSEAATAWEYLAAKDPTMGRPEGKVVFVVAPQ